MKEIKNLKKWFSKELNDKGIIFNNLSNQEKVNELVSLFLNRGDLIEYFEKDALMRTIRLSFEIIEGENSLFNNIILSENALKRIGIKTNINEVLDGFFLLEFEEQERKELRNKIEKMEKFENNKKEFKNGK